MKCKKLLITALIMGVTLLCSCGGKDEIPIEVVTPVRLENVELSKAEMTAISYAEYLISGEYEKAFNLVYVPEDYFINLTQFKEVENKFSSLNSTWELINYSTNGDTIKLEYGKKIGVEYGKAKKGEEKSYLGDRIQGRKSFNIEITQEGIKPNMVMMDSDFLSAEVISVKFPSGVDVWLGNKLLDDAERDNDGYYNITNFVDTEILTLTADCDVEKGKVINLNLKAQIGEEIVDGASLAPTGVHNGNNAWDYVWETDRVTNEEAAEWISNAFQTIFNSIVMRDDFMRATFRKEVMSEKANLETIKVAYMKCHDMFSASKTTLYTDLTCVSFTPYTKEECLKRDVVFEMLDSKTMRIYGVMHYSYIKYNFETDDSSVRSGEVKGQVTLTKDGDDWKFLSFDERFLRGVV